jgi:hypothetical protein
MDSDYQIDVAEVNKGVLYGEIIALYFPLLRKTLLMDTRTNNLDGPMICVVPMAASPEERFKDLIRMRPRFPKPESITIIAWPKLIGSLASLGVYDQIVRRFLEIGPPEIVKKCEECLQELQRFEREQVLDVIRGENCESLWDAHESNEPDDEDPTELESYLEGEDDL